MSASRAFDPRTFCGRSIAWPDVLLFINSARAEVLRGAKLPSETRSNRIQQSLACLGGDGLTHGLFDVTI